MFYSHLSWRVEFILFAVLSTHFLLHQYFISSSFTCCSLLFFPLSFCHVFVPYLTFPITLTYTKLSPPPLVSCVFFHLFCVSLELLCSEVSSSWSTGAVCRRRSWTLSFTLVASRGAFTNTRIKKVLLHRRRHGWWITSEADAAVWSSRWEAQPCPSVLTSTLIYLFLYFLLICRELLEIWNI